MLWCTTPIRLTGLASPGELLGLENDLHRSTMASGRYFPVPLRGECHPYFRHVRSHRICETWSTATLSTFHRPHVCEYLTVQKDSNSSTFANHFHSRTANPRTSEEFNLNIALRKRTLLSGILPPLQNTETQNDCPRKENHCRIE